MPRHKIIFDTDPGIDDAMALLLLARHPDVDLLAVTSVFGNADIDTATRNALFLKDRFGFAARVARGAGRPLVGEPDTPPDFVHGRNGLGNIAIAPPVATLDPLPAHRLIIELLRANPGEVTIVAVGRMTNLAHALAEAPGITGLVKAIVVMGGAFGFNGHTGNVTPVAEANIIGDPHAADIVFGASWPMTIVGLDVTQQTIMTDAWLDELARNAGDDGKFIREVSAFYQEFHRQSAGINGFYVHDSSAVGYALHPEFFTTRRARLRVVPDGIAVGQTIAYLDGKSFPATDWDGRPLQNICVAVDSERFLNFYRETLVG